MNKKIISYITALIFSVILWGSVTLTYDFFTTAKMPLKVIGIPHGYALSGITSAEVSLKLKAQGWKLASLYMGGTQEYKISAEMDSGKINLNLNNALSENTWLSSNVEVLDISPDNISIKVEKILQKKVKIEPRLKLSFKANYGLVSDVHVMPESVMVLGTKSILNKLNCVKTLPRTFENLEGKVTEKLDLEEAFGIALETRTCFVKFDVQEIADKNFEDLPVKVINMPPARDLSLFPNKVSIVLRGGIKTLGRLKSENFSPYVDYNQVIKDTLGFIEPVVSVPGYTRIIDKKPNKLKYIIKKY